MRRHFFRELQPRGKEMTNEHIDYWIWDEALFPNLITPFWNSRGKWVFFRSHFEVTSHDGAQNIQAHVRWRKHGRFPLSFSFPTLAPVFFSSLLTIWGVKIGLRFVNEKDSQPCGVSRCSSSAGSHTVHHRPTFVQFEAFGARCRVAEVAASCQQPPEPHATGLDAEGIHLCLQGDWRVVICSWSPVFRNVFLRFAAIPALARWSKDNCRRRIPAPSCSLRPVQQHQSPPGQASEGNRRWLMLGGFGSKPKGHRPTVTAWLQNFCWHFETYFWLFIENEIKSNYLCFLKKMNFAVTRLKSDNEKYLWRQLAFHEIAISLTDSSKSSGQSCGWVFLNLVRIWSPYHIDDSFSSRF